MPLSPGDRIGPYEITAPLGAGGMGEVYRARDARLQRDVAIKILTAAAVGDADRRRRFETEARTASALNHPNILSIFDIGETNGAPYLVSELVDGETLRGKTLSVRTLLDIAVQITDGLAAAHQAGITHRDLKPDNLMLTREGRVKILDFGLAKFESIAPNGESGATLAMTQPGVVLGTWAYMSPEQARGEPADARSDQFSFGLVLYELATGKPAFAARNAAELFSGILRDDPEPITKLNPRIPAPLQWIVERCMAKDAGQRFASTADLHRVLRDLRDHLSEALTTETSLLPIAPASASGPVSRRLWPWATAAATFVLGCLLARVAVAPEGPGLGGLRFTPFATEEGFESSPAWSPDGKTIAYVAEIDGVTQVLTRSLDAANSYAANQGAVELHATVLVAGRKQGLLSHGAKGPLVGGCGRRSAPTCNAKCRHRVITPDGKDDHTLTSSNLAVFGFSKDGAKIHAVRGGKNQGWERVTFDTRDGRESNLAELRLPRSTTLSGFSIHPDGQRFATPVLTRKSDIWILEGFRPAAGWRARLWRQ